MVTSSFRVHIYGQSYRTDVPSKYLGEKICRSPFADTSTDLFRVIASENQTIVNVEGNSNMQLLLNAGEYSDFDASNGAYIEADKPISVAQYIKGQDCNGGVGDPSMVILNTVE